MYETYLMYLRKKLILTSIKNEKCPYLLSEDDLIFM